MMYLCEAKGHFNGNTHGATSSNVFSIGTFMKLFPAMYFNVNNLSYTLLLLETPLYISLVFECNKQSELNNQVFNLAQLKHWYLGSGMLYVKSDEY